MTITAHSFLLINATPEKIAQLDTALKYLQERSPNIAKPILELAAENQVRIVFSDPILNPHDGYGEAQHSIVWNPIEGLVVKDSHGKPIGVQSAANGLFHEIAHSIDIDIAAREDINLFPNPQYYNESEAMATIYADAVANDCGEILRQNYEGDDIIVTNVTAHTSSNGVGQQV